MNNDHVADRVRACLAQVFNLDPGSLGPDSSPDSVEGWDSLGQLNLIMALEEEFHVTFTDDQSLQLRNFELVVSVVREALGES